jgi:hypothetical protein
MEPETERPEKRSRISEKHEEEAKNNNRQALNISVCSQRHDDPAWEELGETAQQVRLN